MRQDCRFFASIQLSGGGQMAAKAFTFSKAKASVYENQVFMAALVKSLQEALQRADRDARQYGMDRHPTAHIKGQLWRCFKSIALEETAQRYMGQGLVKSYIPQRYDGRPFRSGEVVLEDIRLCFASRDYVTGEIVPNQRHRQLTTDSMEQTRLIFDDLEENIIRVTRQLTGLITCASSKEEPGVLADCRLQFVHGKGSELCWPDHTIDLLQLAEDYAQASTAVAGAATLTDARETEVPVDEPNIRYRSGVRSKSKKNG